MTGTSGHLEGQEHVLPVRVYYEDTDAGGIVYHARYLNYAERARTELLRLAGIDQSQLSVEYGMAFAVRNCTVDFLKPARFDDLIEVRSSLTGLEGATLSAEQRICRNGEQLARIAVRVAALRRDGRPTRIPAAVRESLKSYVNLREQR